MDRFAELKAFCLVASNGGFSAAARQLNVATSSVTRLVDALEARIGAPLLNRSTRSITLTDSGRGYFEQATQILAALDEADDAASGRDAEPTGVLRITAPVTLANRYIAPLLPQLAQKYPKLELDMRLSDAMVNMVDEAIDVAIRIGNPERQPNLIARKLAGHKRYICASPDYLAKHGTPGTPDELANHNCLLFSYGAGRASWRLRNADLATEVEVRGSISVNNAEMLRQAAVGGLGMVMLAAWLIQADLDSGRLVAVLSDYQVNPGEMDVGIYAVYPANRRGATKIQVFTDMLAVALEGSSGPEAETKPAPHW
ncbi:LysR family transcriptional regulator [Duganella sp. FT80W]|uniref:LysR family transcriptional regulator n=1 Tax=Duganella guangzhouensis TaxID=2666084 RepID=A0A6I2L562_9BURK|nr:LysR family transcriptional regulator [Duganella guangzhouensis]MRW92920.1 LysR family transcriptional regulator [Duganella guangzhouensis]